MEVMKTLSEHEQERADSEKKAQKAYWDQLRQWLTEQECKDIPLIEEDGRSPREVEKFRDYLREQVRKGMTTRRGVACDHCGTEMVAYGSMLLSNPPQVNVGCVGCGWHTYMRY